MNWLNTFFPDTMIPLIAEIGLNHGGSLEQACEMVTSAKRAGAHGVKFQIIHGESLYSVYSASYSEKSVPKYDTDIIDFFNSLSLTDSEYTTLKQYCDELDILFFATVFDQRGVELIEKLEVPLFKVASSDITNISLLQSIQSTGKPVVLSTGMASDDEISRGLKALAGSEIMLLHCVSLYPAPPDTLNLGRIKYLRETFSLPVGFSDHSRSVVPSLGAVAAGAQMIERHFTNIHGEHILDDSVSFDEKQFQSLVQQVVELESCFTVPKNLLSEDEINMRRLSRRSLYAACDIKAGSKIVTDMIVCKRPEAGIGADKIDRVCGLHAACDIQCDQVITAELLEGDYI